MNSKYNFDEYAAPLKADLIAGKKTESNTPFFISVGIAAAILLTTFWVRFL